MVTDELSKSRRAYNVLARCNQLIVRDTPADELLARFCALAVEQAGYRMAWVGVAMPDQSVKPVAHFGLEAGYLSIAEVSWADGPTGRGPTGRAIRERRPVIFSRLSAEPEYEPWRDEALARGYASSIALPLIEGGRVLGALNLYAPEPDAFDDAELALLFEVASDLAFGLRSAERREALSRAVGASTRLERLTATVRVASGAIHDLNNLLTIVQGAATQMRVVLGAHSVVQGELQEIEEAVAHSAMLARQTLEFARSRPSGGALLRLDEAVDRVWPMLHRLLSHHHVASVVHDGGCEVAIDALGFEQVLLNLVTNARDAMPSGGPLTVRTGVDVLEGSRALAVGVLAPGRWAHLSVEDGGDGMSVEVQQRIFEPFFTTRATGTGVGLATVFSLVMQFGGAIDVHSVLGRGSRFDVYLPCHG
jgi:signal transduction histidine kinase